MAANDPTQFLQKGFRVALGGATLLLEAIQDPSKRETNLSKLQMEFTELAQELEEKGAVTEQEARTFVDGLIAQQQAQRTQNNPYDPSSTSTGPTEIPIDLDDGPLGSATSPVDPNVQADLQELTRQISSLRTELERLRSEESGDGL
ncbi:hypothetical protein [Leptolyngbya sp. FACHB-261]|uniref:hypothetical protein n=1 Tax=Leptolyngbya sp. FACHB-261 TaxID=2692806 RepID=UPI001689C520|nr:hypothetical protein [Leptolyngbya sp. FACHB-261]MBD2104159.1 hypothetical protein [Leptolyngbya sp. FACHB-261]